MWRQSTKSLSNFIIILASFVFQPATAATIEQNFDSIMGCDIIFSGQILSGDAENLRQLISKIDFEQGVYMNMKKFSKRSDQHKRVCFNSSGGSFLESIEIARVLLDLGKGSAIGKDMICESACALAFLAGSRFSDYDLIVGDNRSLDRILHPNGLLGFHSPRLILENIIFTEKNIEEAYGLALQTLYEIFELKGEIFLRSSSQTGFFETKYFIPERLLRDILATKPSEMKYLKTIGDASDWGINIGPLDFLPINDSLTTLSYACDNTRRFYYPYTTSGLFQEPISFGAWNRHRIGEFVVERATSDFSGLLDKAFSSISFVYKLTGMQPFRCELGAFSIESLSSFNELGLARIQVKDNSHLVQIFPYHMIPPRVEINSLPAIQLENAMQPKVKNILGDAIEDAVKNLQ